VDAEPASAQWTDIRAWRVRTRARLVKERLSQSDALHQQLGHMASARLLSNIDLSRYAILGVYSPMRGEIDIHDVAQRHLAQGGVLALPVVVEKSTPVEFWRWRPGMPMQRGVWNIAIPAHRERVVPDALIVPLLGFDRALYRLGYGGGYYDRTLAQSAPRPYCIGLGFQTAILPTIHPQPHDIPMDRIVTEERVYP